MAEIESLLIRLEADAALMRREMSRAADGVDKFADKSGRSLTRFERNMAGAQRRAGQFAAGMAGAFAAAFGARAVGDAVNFAATLNHVARRVGFTAEQVQELRFAASDFGIAANAVDMGLQRFARRLGQAAEEGSGELLPTLQRLGVAFQNADGTTRDSMEVLYDYADAVAALDNPQARLLAAFKAFDSEGAAMVNVLSQGSAGMRAYAADASALGLVLSNDATQAAADLDRQLDILTQRMRTQFAGAIVENAEGLEDLATAAGHTFNAFALMARGASAFGEDMGEFTVWMQRALGIMPEVIEASAGVEQAFLDAANALDADELDVGDIIRDLREAGEVGENFADQIQRALEDTTGDAFFARLQDISAELRTAGQRAQTLINLQASMGMAPDRAEPINADDLFAGVRSQMGLGSSGNTLEDGLSSGAVALRQQQQITDVLRRRIALMHDTDQAQAELNDRLAGEAAVRAAIARAQGNEGSAGPIDALRAEAVEASRLTRQLQELTTARQEAVAAATAVAEGSMTATEAFEAQMADLRALMDNGTLGAAAIEVGLDVDTVAARRAVELVRELQEAGELAGEDAAYLREQLGTLNIPDSVIEKMALIPDVLKEAADEAENVWREIGEGIGGNLEDAIMKGGELRDVLGAIAQDLARMLLRRNLIEPLTNAISGIGGGGSGSFLSNLIGGAASGGTKALGSMPITAAASQAKMAAAPGGSGGFVYSPVISINAPGADAAALRRVEEEVRGLREEGAEQMLSAMRERDRRFSGVN